MPPGWLMNWALKKGNMTNKCNMTVTVKVNTKGALFGLKLFTLFIKGYFGCHRAICWLLRKKTVRAEINIQNKTEES